MVETILVLEKEKSLITVGEFSSWKEQVLRRGWKLVEYRMEVMACTQSRGVCLQASWGRLLRWDY